MELLLSIYSSTRKRKLASVLEEESIRKKDLTSKIFCLEGIHCMKSITPYDYERHITFQKKPSPPLLPNPGQLVRKEHSTI
jgi:hypothetical protein